MNFYDQFVLPHLINLAMRNKDATRCRAEMIPQARGHVVEIGIGSGLNLPFYSGEVSKVSGVDPSTELLKMTAKKTHSVPFQVELISSSAEELPLESNSADTVVTTFTLCSIPDPEKALAEVWRVLKPGGTFLFVEHGAAPEAKVRTWQNRINRAWGALAGGCNLNREIDHLIPAAGLGIQQLQTAYMRGPKIFTFVYKGSARK